MLRSRASGSPFREGAQLSASKSRTTLFRKYAGYFAGLTSLALLASGLVGLFFDYRESRVLIEALQREKVRAVASSIEQFARRIETQLRAPLLLRQVGGISENPEELQLELIRLLRQAPALIDVAWIDANGVQLAKVSRIGLDEIRPSARWTDDSAFIAARAGAFHAAPVYFRAESEPYAVFTVGGDDPAAGILRGEVNLKFVWDVVSAIRIGHAGFAYVVDSSGRLISHPDIGLVLKKTELSAIPQVRAALAATGPADRDVVVATSSSMGSGHATLNALAAIPLLGWRVLIEQPLAEAYAPLYDEMLRTAALLVLGVGFAVIAALALARRMSAPIQLLTERVTQIGEGRFEQRVDVATGDELQALADQFNRMAEKLQESYSGLEQKIAERTCELAAANKAKSRFLAVASHDLRQPMHALGLFVAQLKDANSAVERERLLRKVEASSEALSELLDALLDISKLDAGTVTAHCVAFDMQSLLDRVDHAFSVQAQAKGLRLRIRPSTLRIHTDPLLLARIIDNLVTNAVRYTRDGGVLVACRRRANRARIEVWDTGCGIPAAETDQIFGEFYQASRPAVGEAQAIGLGLGLAIVERLTRLLAVDVSVRSIEGRGSLFTVSVPLAKAGAVPASEHRERSAMRFDGLLAVIIDDECDAREALAGLLRQWGWRVLAAQSGDQALAALDGEPAGPDVVIADYRLRGDELGTHVIARVRAARGTTIPAIVVSGELGIWAPESQEFRSLRWLHKPLHAAKLRALLQHLRSQEEPADPATL